jgi:hypothetical protein
MIVNVISPFRRPRSRLHTAPSDRSIYTSDISPSEPRERKEAPSEPRVPESSEHTSIKQRVDHAQAQGRTGDLAAARESSLAGSIAAAGIEESLWLCPIEDRRGVDSQREGMIEGFSLGNYLLLVDYTGRLLREGKAGISCEFAEILQRLGSSAETWQARLEQLKSRGGRLLGRFFAVTRERLRAVAKQCGVHRLANLCGCPAG